MTDEIVSEYLQHALDSASEIESLILSLEQNGYEERLLRKLKIILHSIKGSSSSYGFSSGSSICHKMEDIIATISPESLKPETIARLLYLKDLLTDSFENTDETQSMPIDELNQPLKDSDQNVNLGDLCALLVSTSRSLEMLLSKALSDLGVSITCSRDCYEALGLLIHNNFNFVFTTYEMPMFTGDQMLRAFRILLPDSSTKCFLLTTRTDSQHPEYVTVLKKNNKIAKTVSDIVRNNLALIKKNLEEKSEIKGDKLRKVVHIDDDPYIQKLVELGLKKFSTEVYQSTDPEDTIRLCMKHKPDAILLDYYLGETEGHAILKKLKESSLTRKYPVIFMTGEEDPEKIKNLFALGCAGIIKKPFKAVDLKKIISDIVFTASS